MLLPQEGMNNVREESGNCDLKKVMKIKKWRILLLKTKIGGEVGC